MKNRGESLRLEGSARLEIALLAVLALCAIGVQRACGEDPPPPPPPPPLPEYVFAYNQPGNVFDNNAAGHVWSELGLLDATGKPGKVGEDGKIRDGNGKVLGSAIKNASGNVIGYRSADGKKEAYNLGGTNPDGTASPGATLDEAWQRVAPNGYLHIIKHGAYWVDDKGVFTKEAGFAWMAARSTPGLRTKDQPAAEPEPPIQTDPTG